VVKLCTVVWFCPIVLWSCCGLDERDRHDVSFTSTVGVGPFASSGIAGVEETREGLPASAAHPVTFANVNNVRDDDESKVIGASAVISVDEVMPLETVVSFVAVVVSSSTDVGSDQLLDECLAAEKLGRIATSAVKNQVYHRLDGVSFAFPKHESDLALGPTAESSFVHPSTMHGSGQIFIARSGLGIGRAISHNVKGVDSTVSLIPHDQAAIRISSTKELWHAHFLVIDASMDGTFAHIQTDCGFFLQLVRFAFDWILSQRSAWGLLAHQLFASTIIRFYNRLLAWRAVGASHLGAVFRSNGLASLDSSTSARFDLLGLLAFAAALLGHQCFASTLFLIRLDTGIHHAMFGETDFANFLTFSTFARVALRASAFRSGLTNSLNALTTGNGSLL